MVHHRGARSGKKSRGTRAQPLLAAHIHRKGQISRIGRGLRALHRAHARQKGKIGRHFSVHEQPHRLSHRRQTQFERQRAAQRIAIRRDMAKQQDAVRRLNGGQHLLPRIGVIPDRRLIHRSFLPPSAPA